MPAALRGSVKRKGGRSIFRKTKPVQIAQPATSADRVELLIFSAPSVARPAEFGVSKRNMKTEKPKIPNGAPEETKWFGGPIDWFRITVRITSQDLVPEEVTEILGCEPDESQQKGKPLLREDGSIKRIPKFGAWELIARPKDTDEWDCCEAAMELLRRLPSDTNKWLLLSKRYKICILFALSFESSNKEFSLSNEFLKYTGLRGIFAGFDIYHEEREV